MIKTYLLDTNVLIHDPSAIFKFEDNNVVLPIFVLEEIDNFKMEMTERGRSARQVARTLDDLRKEGSLSSGVPLPGGGKLTVYVPPDGAPRGDNVDQMILLAVVSTKKSSAYPVIFVTMDINLRVRADSLGLTVESYENQSVDVSTLYTGVIEISTDDFTIDTFYNERAIEVPDGYYLQANDCVMLKSPSKAGLGRFYGGLIHTLKLDKKHGPSGIKARNREQVFAMDLLMDPNVSLVTLVGVAGTGKTLMALAAALELLGSSHYDKVLISRPIMPMGRDLGYLPGDIDEKMGPWMRPLFDNLDYIGGAHKKQREIEEWLNNGTIQVEPLTYIRGRSLPHQFILIDESQNLTPHETKTIITRAGEGTKIVMTGDPHQIDNPYVDATSNGLSVTANLMRGQSLAGHVTLVKGERSPLADLAVKIL